MKNIFFLITIIVIIITISACSDKSKNTAATVTAASTATQSLAQGQYVTSPAFVEHPDTAKIEYPDTTLYYENGKHIISYNPRTQEKHELLAGSNSFLSHQKDKIAYLARASSSEQSGFSIFNLNTGENKLVFKTDGNDPISLEGWSPDDKYIILHSATDVHGETIIYDSVTGKKVSSFGTNENKFTWMNSDEVILSDLQTIPNRKTYGGPYAYGIAIINVKTNEKTIIQKATPTTDYWLIKYEYNKVLFSSTSIPPDGIWGKDEEKTIYLLMNNNGKILNEVKNYQVPEYQEDVFSLEIKKILPSTYKEYNYIKAVPCFAENWVLIMANKNSNYDYEIFILDKNNPHSLRKIGTGYLTRY